MYGIAGLLTGRTLAGRYRIDAVIGRGGMGAVYRATDERLAREVAVKVIGAVTTDPAEHERLRARFHREARAAAHLRHANVVQVFDFGTEPELDLDFLVMELLRGEDLAVRLTRGGAPPPHFALCVLRQAARGLAAGHRAGMVHRDVKPGNIFLESGDTPGEPQVKLLDFGIAQVASDEGTLTHLTEYGRSPYSPAYASPEQLRGEEEVTPASDVFSLAAVGYHLFTGTRAFTSADPTRMSMELADSLRRLRERVPELDGAVHAALLRALARNPAERFAEAGTFAAALGAGAAPTEAPLRPAVTAEHADSATLLAPTPRPGSAAQPEEQTRLFTRPRPVRREAPPEPAPPPAVRGQAAATPAAHPPEAPRRPGAFRRFLRGVWEFTATVVAMGLFVGAWALAVDGVLQGDREHLLLGAGATVLFTPLAIHRLTGRRGRYVLELLGSILATVGAVRLVGTDQDPLILLAAVFGLQVLTSFVMSWLTRRRPREEPEPYATA